jgi:hypothetical protein
MQKLTIVVSDEVVRELAAFRVRHNITQSECMRRVLSVVKIANTQAKQGNSIGVVAEDGCGNLQVVAKILGI